MLVSQGNTSQESQSRSSGIGTQGGGCLLEARGEAQCAVREGDANTEYFHAQAKQRLPHNKIKSIELNGVSVTLHQGKVAAFTNYFKEIMGTPGDSRWDFDLDRLYQDSQTVSEALTAPFTVEEALHEVCGMGGNNARGADGFGPSFYKAAWQTVKEGVMAFLHAFHSVRS